MQSAKRVFLISAACFVVAAGYAQDSTKRADGEVFSLQQCVETALKNNTTVRTNLFTMETDKVTRLGALGNMLPSISASGSNANYNGRSLNPNTNQFVNSQNTGASYSLSGSLVIWNGSYLRNYLLQTNDAYKAGEMDVQNAKDQTTILIILDYLSSLSATEQLSAAIASDSATLEQVRVYEAKNREGSIAPGDYYTLKGQLGANNVQVTTAKNALEVAKLTLSQDMNISYSTGMSLTPISYAETVLQPYGSNVEDIYAFALHNLAMIRSVDLKEQAAIYAIKSTRGQYYPQLYLYGGINTNYSSVASLSRFADSTANTPTGSYINYAGTKIPVLQTQYNYDALPWHYGAQLKSNVYYTVGIGINIPIVNYLNARTRVKNAKIQEKVATFNQTTTRIQLRQAIEKDYVNMTAAYETYKALLQQVSDYTQSYNAAKAKLDVGTFSTYDFVISKNNLDGATLNLIAAKYNYVLQTKVLDYYLGKLTY